VVNGFVFYDENANGVFDPAETVRLPAVSVSVGGASATTVAGGRFSLSVPNGAQTAQATSLPPYFKAAAAVSVGVPASGDVAVPAVLPIGPRAKANVYLAFGDSITAGDGSSDGTGYRDYLSADLRAYWGRADMVNDGLPGSKSVKGQARIPGSLASYRPAYALILYGTNDWNEAECRSDFPCYTVEALRSMVQDTRSGGAFPILGTIPPVNPAYVDRNPEERNDWVKRMNDLVRAMAKQEGVPVAEVHGEFLKQSSLPPLFADDKHPNDAGYRLIARAFFDAITKPAAASAGRGFFFEAPGGF
jgi:lysophospholipase L1-like esterase